MPLIYLLRNSINGKVYVGQHNGTDLHKRWKHHMRHAKQGSRLPLHCAIRKYGPDAFDVCVLSTSASSQTDLDTQEVLYIAKYRANDSAHGYNLTLGGTGFRGFRPWNKGKKLPEWLCRKLSVAHKNQKPTAYQIQRAIETNTGRKDSEETRLKKSRPKSAKTRKRISAARRKQVAPMTGKTHSLETRKKQSRAAKARWAAVKLLKTKSINQ